LGQANIPTRHDWSPFSYANANGFSKRSELLSGLGVISGSRYGIGACLSHAAVPRPDVNVGRDVLPSPPRTLLLSVRLVGGPPDRILSSAIGVNLVDVIGSLQANAENIFAAIAAWITQFAPNIIAALLIVSIGFILARWAGKASARAITRSKSIDNTKGDVIRSIVGYALSAIAVIAALGQLGFQTTSLLAALGAIGLAIGLALQKTLANIAAGIMLLWLTPFRLGDYIEADSGAGTVREVGLFATELESWDGIFQFVPNSELWNTRIVNYSRYGKRLVEVKVGISYDDDIDQARQLLMDLATNDDRVIAEPAEPFVFVDTLADSSVVMSLRVWASSDNYWPLLRDLTESAKRSIEDAGLAIPFPQIQLHVPALNTPPKMIAASQNDG
jgi:small conductance mechanosensitive channel